MLIYRRSYDRYKQEITNGDIKWNLLHTTEFWEENYKEFYKDNYKCIRILISILESVYYNNSIKSIVCFDLGEFARLYPNGAQYISLNIVFLIV